MGTNYYFRKPLTNHCEHCGRSDPPEELHIGKSSRGWCFSLHVIPENDPENDICSLADWEVLWPSGTIINEYGDELSPSEMLGVITGRLFDKDWDSDWWSPQVFDGFILPGYVDEADFHQSNHSERGPNGLLRHRIDGHCIGHGPGTYDYIIGDFS